MTASSRKAIVLPKNVTELDPTNSRYPSLNYSRSRSELVPVLVIITSFWRIRWKGSRKEESKNESFWYASVQSHFWLAFDNSFIYISGFRLVLLLLQLDHLSTCYSPLFSKLRESTKGMAVLTRREVDDGVRGDVEVPFKSWLFSFLSGHDSNGLKKDSTPPPPTVKTLK